MGIFSNGTLCPRGHPSNLRLPRSMRGVAVYSPALGDFIFMGKGLGAMFLTGPAVVDGVTGADVNKELPGGP